MTATTVCTDRHLSYSQVSLYQQCPLRYRFQYIDGLEPAFINAALPFGKSVHHAIAAYWQSLLEGNPFGKEEVGALFEASWADAHDEETPILYSDQEDFYSLQAKGANLVSYFWQHYQPGPIVGIEESFEVNLGDALPPFVGRIDLLEEAPDGRLMIVDLKTACRKPSPSQIDTDLQLTFYSLAALELGWTEFEPIVGQLVLVKTQQPQLHVLTGSRQNKDRDWTRRLLKAVWKGIEREVFYPNPGWLCASCPYQEPCRDWR